MWSMFITDATTSELKEALAKAEYELVELVRLGYSRFFKGYTATNVTENLAADYRRQIKELEEILNVNFA